MYSLKMDSKYLDRFRELQKVEGVRLTGNKLLIEEIKTPELKTQGGLIIATKVEGYAKSSTANGLTQVGLVLMLGEDSKLPSGEELKVGDIVWVAEMGVRPCTSFPGIQELTDETLQLTSTDNINMVFSGGLKTYEAAINALNNPGGTTNEEEEAAAAQFPTGKSQAV